MLFPLPGILFHQMCMPPSLLSFKSLLEGPLSMRLSLWPPFETLQVPALFLALPTTLPCSSSLYSPDNLQ